MVLLSFIGHGREDLLPKDWVGFESQRILSYTLQIKSIWSYKGQEGSIRLLRAISRYDPDKKIKFLTYAGPAICNAMMDLISTAFSAFEQKMQSDKDGIPMKRINLDEMLPGEDSMQRSDLIADPYSSEPEKMMIGKESRARSTEALALDNLWRELPWWY